MTWSLRTGLGLLGFGVAGLTLLALQPTAKSANDPDGHGYIFAISHGPGLSLAHSNAPLLQRDNVKSLAASARSLACEVVLTIGSIEIGSRCAYDGFDSTTEKPPLTTSSIHR